VEIVCADTPPCGFRVHEHYYAQKPKFSRTSCARCSGPIKIVNSGTNTKVAGATMNIETGRIETAA